MRHLVRSGWWQVAVALIIQAISAASIFTGYSIVAAPLKAEFQPSQMLLMLAMTVTALASGILSPAIGSAIDRFSIRRLMLIGSTLLGSGFFLLSLVSSMTQVLLIYGFFMATSAILLGPIACSALLSRWFTRRRGLAMGLAASGGSVGGLILPPLLQLLLDHYDWRPALQIFSALVFCFTFPLILIIIRDKPPEPTSTADSQSATEQVTAEAAAAAQAPKAVGTLEALKQPTFWLIALVLGTIFCGPMGLISNMLPFAETKGMPATQGALLLSILSGASFAGKLVWSSIIDHLNLKLALAIMLSGLGLAIFGMNRLEGFGLITASFLLCGMTSGGAVPLWTLLLTRVYGPTQLGRIMGIMTLVIMPFTLFSPPVFGYVFDQTGRYENALLGYIGMVLFALLLLTQLRITQGVESRAAVQSAGA